MRNRDRVCVVGSRNYRSLIHRLFHRRYIYREWVNNCWWGWQNRTDLGKCTHLYDLVFRRVDEYIFPDLIKTVMTTEMGKYFCLEYVVWNRLGTLNFTTLFTWSVSEVFLLSQCLDLRSSFLLLIFWLVVRTDRNNAPPFFFFCEGFWKTSPSRRSAVWKILQQRRDVTVTVR